ncbi:unnamed protein product [Rotaria sp. Silwood1]|nr:unnamed protein product [Rotaria sp. Silwood1]
MFDNGYKRSSLPCSTRKSLVNVTPTFREDDQIADLTFLNRSKLYEAIWIELQNLAHIAKCDKVWYVE